MAYRAASPTSCSCRLSKNGSPPTRRASVLASVANAASISPSVPAFNRVLADERPDNRCSARRLLRRADGVTGGNDCIGVSRGELTCQRRQFFYRPEARLDNEVPAFGKSQPGELGKHHSTQSLKRAGANRQHAEPVDLFGCLCNRV